MRYLALMLAVSGCVQTTPTRVPGEIYRPTWASPVPMVGR